MENKATESKKWEIFLCSGAEHLEKEFIEKGFSVTKSERNYDENRKFSNSDVYSCISTIKNFSNKRVCVIQSFSCSGGDSIHNFTTGDRLLEAIQILDIFTYPREVEYPSEEDEKDKKDEKREFIKLDPPEEIVLIALHLPCSKQDQLYRTGESNSCHSAIRALFNAGAEKIIAIDPHVPKEFEWFQEYLNNGKIKILSMYRRAVSHILKRHDSKELILVSTPGKKRFNLGKELSGIKKLRKSTNKVEVGGEIDPDLIGEPVFLIDDMILSGTTMIALREFLIEENKVAEVFAYATHALPAETDKEKKLHSLMEIFEKKLYVSNTIRSKTFQKDYPQYYISCVPLIIEEFLRK